MAKKLSIKIYYDELTGEVDKVDYTKRFELEPRLFRMDVLKSALVSLDILYDFELEKLAEELNAQAITKAGEA